MTTDAVLPIRDERLVTLALAFHAAEGLEHDCTGLMCPGVARILMMLESAVGIVGRGKGNDHPAEARREAVPPLDDVRDSGIEAMIENITRQVAELPNRTSPDDWPEAMLVTQDELESIIREALRSALSGVSRPQKPAEEPSA